MEQLLRWGRVIGTRWAILLIFGISCFEVHSQVTADFTASVESGCSPLTVQFVPQTTGAVVSYSWDFGNGNTSNLPAPAVIYLNPGQYTITLIVSDGVQTDTMRKPQFITVFADPNPQFGGTPLSGCLPLDVQFSDSTLLGDAPIQQYTWDFGDGNISNAANPLHTYTSSGMFDVTLVVVDTNGCSNTLLKPDFINTSNAPQASFSWQFPGGCQSPLAVDFNASVTPAATYTYLWDFGDGNTSTQANPQHSYLNTGLYTVSLIVRDPNGCADTAIIVDAIQFTYPNAGFNLGSPAVCEGEALVITNTSTDASVYTWDFGDGNTFTGPNPVHRYRQAGTYQLSLIAYNAFGCTDTLVYPQPITVSPSPSGTMTVDAPTACRVPHLVNFSAATSQTQSYLWDFGDGASANVQNPSHVYTQKGIFDVQLILESASGCRDTILQPSFIQIIPPQAAFAPDTTEGCVTLGVNFNDLSVSQFDTITDWIWDFGDGGGSFLQDPSHTFLNVGQFEVSLIVATQGGCRDTVRYAYISAGAKPNTQFIATPLVVCAEDPVSFIDQTPNVNEWEWYFGDGSSSTQQFPVYNYGDTGHFTVMLITRQFGCADTLIRPDYVFVEGPIADFTLNPTQGCDTPLTVTFTDASILATDWVWDFGDGSPQDTSQHPIHTYTQPGNYVIRLTVSNDTLSCVDDYDWPLTIASPFASFTQSDTLGCTGFPVSFTNNSIGGNTYLWEFGDGDSSTQENPTHSFRSPGTFLVRLTVFGPGGCTDTMLSQVPIRIVGPQAAFSGDTLTGCAPLTTRFTDQSFALPAGNLITGWFWDFGDGNTATGPNPVHTFNQAGDFDIQLVVIDNLGCTDTLIRESYIQPTFPTADFRTEDTLTCPGAPVSFVNLSSGVGNTYLWEFGDGTSSAVQNPVHIYPATTGSYTVRLTATDINGCVSQNVITNLVEVGPPVASFFASPTQQACPPLAVGFINQSSSNVVNWFWDFGDGTNSTLANPSKVYSLPGVFDVRLVVETAQGCRDTLVRPWLIDLSGPTGSFSMTPLSGCTPLQVQFTANTTNAIQWTWDFGDGNLGLGQSVSHTYTNDTTAFPVLVVRDSGGCTVAIPAPDSIVIEAGPDPTFMVNDSTACLGQPLNFFNTTQTLIPIVSYFWDFGDGDTASTSNPAHVYTQPGNYNVQLTLAYQNGCVDSALSPLNISVNPLPEARIQASQLVGCVPFTVNFADSTTFGSGPAAYFWDFGDGNVATVKSPTHTYTVPGTYQVNMWFSDGNGCEDSATEVITVYPGPTTDFSVSATDGCAPKTVQFTDQSTSASPLQQWLWDFGDGTTSNQANPQHTYRTNGDFDVSLTVVDGNGCADVRLYPDLISLDAPSLNFTSNATPVCPPADILFTSTATADTTITDWYWSFGDGQTDTMASPVHAYQQPGTYDVTLVVTDANGCRDTLRRPALVQLLPRPTARFALSDSQACLPLTIQVSDSSQAASLPIVNIEYELSNGMTANVPNPSFYFADSGMVQINQIVTDVNGCSDTASLDVQLFPGIEVAFTASDSMGCTSSLLTLIDQSTGGGGAVAWRWDFGNGATDSVKFPSYTYPQTGIYDVSLRATNVYGCSDSLTKPQWIQIEGPLADFTPDSASVCPMAPIPFADLSTHGSAIVQYEWDFGDGNVGNGPNPVHSYVLPGDYSVRLTITDALGCQAEIVKVNAIEVVTPPAANFSLSDSMGCAPLGIQANDQSIAGDGQIVRYEWDFGNGSGSVFPNASITYANAGNYPITYIAEDAFGCRDTSVKQVEVYGNPSAAFVANLQRGCAPRPIQFLSQSSGPSNIIAWHWDFGDGTTGTGNLFSHIYAQNGSYPVRLAVQDINGCTDTLTRPQFIEIGPPQPQIGLSDSAICPLGTITFFEQSQPDTPFVDWFWDFGNGDSAIGPQPTYQYANPGVYTVRLRAVDALGCEGFDTLQGGISILNPPTAQMLLSDSAGCPPLVVQAADRSTGDRPIVNWDWDMGNGTQANFINVSTTYSQPGLFPVSLIVTDNVGCADTVSQTIEVYGPPVANFLSGKSLACVGEVVSFVDVSQGNAPIQTWLWDFGDGTTSFQASPNHTYTQSGVYDVQLIVWDQRGCADTLVIPQAITITQPQADFVLQGQPGCPGTLVSFTDQSIADTLLTAWQWDFGDGSTGTGSNPQHLYTQPGSYDVRLITTNLLGCLDTLIRPQVVEIFTPPTAGFILDAPGGCVPFVLAGQDTSRAETAIAQWTWYVNGQIEGFAPNLQATLTQAGSNTISLVVEDSRGCRDSVSQVVEGYTSPEADFSSSDTSGCAGMVVRFVDQTSGNINRWYWTFGDGNVDSVAQPIHAYQSDGLFDVSLWVQDENGCTDSIVKPEHIEISRPTGDFFASFIPDCPPVPVTFEAVGSSSRGIMGYEWDFGDGNRATGQVVTHVYTDTGNYQITLFLTDSLGCIFTLVKPDFVSIFGAERPPLVNVHAASVENKESILLNWQPNLNPDFGAYQVYWQDAVGDWQVIHTATGQLDTLYQDNRPSSINTEANSYCYKVVSRNACGIEGSLNLAETHCTNEVNAQALPNRVSLSWTGYQGWDQISQYEIYRVDSYDPTNAIFLDVVPGNSRAYVDSTTRCFNTYSYRIRALGQQTQEISWSDTTKVTNIKTAPQQSSDIVRATVEENQFALVEWNRFRLEDLIEVHLERSVDGVTWQGIATLAPNETSFRDLGTTVASESYAYRLWARDSCGFVSPYSNIGKTILLSGEEVSGGRNLSWTPYEIWEGGVDFYEIQVFNEQTNQFIRVDLLPGDQTSFLDVNTFLNQGSYCYRIIAFEKGGNLAQSISNYVCLGIEPALYVPNAFTPNGDQVNDYFTIGGVYIQDITIKIFNRWGQLVYEAQQIEPGWDGRYKGQLVPEGVYVIVVDALANDGRKLSHKGTISVYR